MRSWRIALALLLVFVAAPEAWGQQPGPGASGHMGHGMMGGGDSGPMAVQVQPGMPGMGGPMGSGMMMRGGMGRGMMMGPMTPPDELPAERPLITFILREKEGSRSRRNRSRSSGRCARTSSGSWRGARPRSEWPR